MVRNPPQAGQAAVSSHGPGSSLGKVSEGAGMVVSDKDDRNALEVGIFEFAELSIRINSPNQVRQEIENPAGDVQIDLTVLRNNLHVDRHQHFPGGEADELGKLNEIAIDADVLGQQVGQPEDRVVMERL
jgi:hypothetical protein